MGRLTTASSELQTSSGSIAVKHNVDGQLAETAAAEYLTSLGYKVLDKNWKTRWCEIDIIALKQDCVYFVEVKYRSKSSQGSGLDYITESKLRQMQFAAEFWIAKNSSYDEFVLSAAEVSGPNFDINFIEQV